MIDKLIDQRKKLRNKSNQKETSAFIDKKRNKIVLIDPITNNMWANEYFADEKEARDFAKQNNINIVEKRVKKEFAKGGDVDGKIKVAFYKWGEYEEDQEIDAIDLPVRELTSDELEGFSIRPQDRGKHFYAEENDIDEDDDGVSVKKSFATKEQYEKGGSVYKYKRPAYDLKTSGVYKFKTKDKEYTLTSYLFERENDTEDSLEIQDELRGKLGAIIIKNSSWNKLSKGENVMAYSSKGNIKGILTRIDDTINSHKYENGGSVEDEFDWNKLFEPVSPKEQEELLLKLKKEEKDTITNEKNIHAKNIRAKGSNWNEAFIFRVKSARYSISKFIEWAKKKDDEKAKDWFNESLEHIDSIRELGYEARRYANSIEKKLRNYYDEIYIKNNKNPKFEQGGEVEDNLIKFEIDFYDDINKTRDNSVELIIRKESLQEAIEYAIEKAKELQKKYIEFYNKKYFIGSIDMKKSSNSITAFSHGRNYNEFISKMNNHKSSETINQTNTNTMTQEHIEKFVRGAKSTNATARDISIKKLKEAGLDKDGKPIKNEPKETKKPAPKPTPAKKEAPKKVEADEPDCEELIAARKKQRAQAKKRAQGPQKTENTKNVEKIEKVETSLEERFKSGKLSKAELTKMYNETKTLLDKIKSLLDKLK